MNTLFMFGDFMNAFSQTSRYYYYTFLYETKDSSKAHLCTVARKPEETCKQGRLLCEPETPG